MLLRVGDGAVLHSISFGKFSRATAEHARDVVVLGGWHANCLTPLLAARLRNSAAVQTFSLLCGASPLIDAPLFAVRFVQLRLLSSFSAKMPPALWRVALHGDARPATLVRVRLALERRVADQSLRRSLAMMRRPRADAPAVDVEHPLVAALLRAALDAPSPLHVAAALESLLARADVRALFDERALSEPPTGARWRNVPTSQPWPAARGGHQVCFDAASGRVFMFAGWSGERDLGDLWSFDMATQRWSAIEPHNGVQPSPRSCHKIAFDPVRRRIYTLGRYLDPPLQRARVSEPFNDFLGDSGRLREIYENVLSGRGVRDDGDGGGGDIDDGDGDGEDQQEPEYFDVDDEVLVEEPAPFASIGSSSLASATVSALASSLVNLFDEESLTPFLVGAMRDAAHDGNVASAIDSSSSSSSSSSAPVAPAGSDPPRPAPHPHMPTLPEADVGSVRTLLARQGRRARAALDFIALLSLLVDNLPSDVVERLDAHFGGTLVLDDAADSGVAVERSRKEDADFWYFAVDENAWHCVSRDTTVDGGPPLIFDQQMCMSDDGRVLYVFGGRKVDDRSRVIMERTPISHADLRAAVDSVVAAAQPPEGGVDGPAPAAGGRPCAQRAGTVTLTSVRARLAVRNRSRAADDAQAAPSAYTYSGLFAYAIDENRWTLLSPDESVATPPATPPDGSDADAFSVFHDVPLRSRIGHSMTLFEEQLHLLGGQRDSEYMADHIVYDLRRKCVAHMTRDTSLLGGPGAGFTQRATLNRAHAEIHVLTGLVRPAHAARELVRNSLWIYSLRHHRWSRVRPVDASAREELTAQDAVSLDEMLEASVRPPTAGEPPVCDAVDARPLPRYAHQCVSDGRNKLLLLMGNPGFGRPRDTERLDDVWELTLERTDGAALHQRAVHAARRFHCDALCDAVHRARESGTAGVEQQTHALAALQDVSAWDPKFATARASKILLGDRSDAPAMDDSVARQRVVEEILQHLPVK